MEGARKFSAPGAIQQGTGPGWGWRLGTQDFPHPTPWALCRGVRACCGVGGGSVSMGDVEAAGTPALRESSSVGGQRALFPLSQAQRQLLGCLAGVRGLAHAQRSRAPVWAPCPGSDQLASSKGEPAAPRPYCLPPFPCKNSLSNVQGAGVGCLQATRDSCPCPAGLSQGSAALGSGPSSTPAWCRPSQGSITAWPL